MEITKYTRALIDRAAAQVVRELSRTPVADLQITGAPTATPWVSIRPQLGPEGGLKYIRVGLGAMGTGYDYAPAPGLIEAIAKQQPVEAHRIVEELIVASLVRRLDGVAPC